MDTDIKEKNEGNNTSNGNQKPVKKKADEQLYEIFFYGFSNDCCHIVVCLVGYKVGRMVKYQTLVYAPVYFAGCCCRYVGRDKRFYKKVIKDIDAKPLIIFIQIQCDIDIFGIRNYLFFF